MFSPVHVRCAGGPTVFSNAEHWENWTKYALSENINFLP